MSELPEQPERMVEELSVAVIQFADSFDVAALPIKNDFYFYLFLLISGRQWD
jgi:hypothetical protein